MKNNQPINENINIEALHPLISPRQLKATLAADQELIQAVSNFREQVARILRHEDDRLLVITGPCSIHNTDAALEYAARLKELQELYRDKLCILMRVYFEKPRTALGWRGIIIDPAMDGSYRISEGLEKARSLLIEIARMGLPVGTEVLDPIIPQFIADLVSWAAIGARTTESQTHRELASGLSMPVGFKNGTDGDLSTAVNAVRSALHSHSFIGIDQDGLTCIFQTRGNRLGHIIMRGGKSGPNYYEKDVEEAEQLLAEIGVAAAIIIDCSHANSGKNHNKQSNVLNAALEIRNKGRGSIRGLMLESNLVSGQQKLDGNISSLTYGQSVTDSCMGWEETQELLAKLAKDLII